MNDDSSKKRYTVRFDDGNHDDIEAEGFRYVDESNMSGELLPLGRVEFFRYGRVVAALNSQRVTMIREV